MDDKINDRLRAEQDRERYNATLKIVKNDDLLFEEEPWKLEVGKLVFGLTLIGLMVASVVLLAKMSRVVL